MSEIVFLLEEPSAEAMLQGLLPKVLPPGRPHRCIVFEGKQDLEKQMVKRMRGYLVPGARFVVLRDQDAGDCKNIKDRLVRKCADARRKHALVRIACHELESWYLADLAAVEKGLGAKRLVRLQGERRFRAPDSIASPSRLLKEIAPGYQKVGGSRAIGPHLDPTNQRSRSFAVFVDGVRLVCDSMKTVL